MLVFPWHFAVTRLFDWSICDDRDDKMSRDCGNEPINQSISQMIIRMTMIMIRKRLLGLTRCLASIRLRKID